MKNVWTVWPSLQKRIQSAKRRLVILDFDGTLAKIAKTPHEVVLKKNTITAPKSGKVVFIGFSDNQPVEYNQILLIIE